MYNKEKFILNGNERKIYAILLYNNNMIVVNFTILQSKNFFLSHKKSTIKWLKKCHSK